MNLYSILSVVAYLFPSKTCAKLLGVKLGNNVLISTKKWSTEPWLITIGDNVQITKDVYFHTHGGSHVARYLYPNFDCFGPITIEDGVYIGSGAHIMPGVTIGKGSLVAAGSIVTKSIPPYSVVAGNPARYICSVEEYINKNLQYDIGTKGMSMRQKKAMILRLPKEKLINK